MFGSVQAPPHSAAVAVKSPLGVRWGSVGIFGLRGLVGCGESRDAAAAAAAADDRQDEREEEGDAVEVDGVGGAGLGVGSVVAAEGGARGVVPPERVVVVRDRRESRPVAPNDESIVSSSLPSWSPAVKTFCRVRAPFEDRPNARTHSLTPTLRPNPNR